MSPHDPGDGPRRARRVLRSLRRLWEPPTGSGPDTRNARDLHVCPGCGRDYVNPAWTDPVDDDTWRIGLRCGGCADTRAVVIGNAEAARFDRELNRGMDVIARSLEALERERMTEWIDAFTGALDRGLVDADDFAVR
jgi:hypothetical protein